MPESLRKMVFSFVKHNTSTKEKSASMLSLSLFGTPSTTTTPTPTPPSSAPSSPSSRRRKQPQQQQQQPRTRTNDVRAEAVTFLGLLRYNEDHLEARLKQLLKKGDRDFVRQLFSQVIDGWTPLHACVLRGARKLVKMALKAGTDPDLEMGVLEGLPGRCSPLHLAAYRGDVSLVQVLVHFGASLGKLDSTERTPLFYAASRGNVLAVKKLLKYGAEVGDLSAEQRVYYKDDIERRRPSSLLCIPVSIHRS